MTYEALQLRDNEILDVLLTARQNSITTMIHAENGDILSWMTNKLEEKGLFEPKYHATSRPQLVETEATNRAITLSELIDTPMLIVHVSSPSAAQHIRNAQTRGLPLYAEVTSSFFIPQPFHSIRRKTFSAIKLTPHPRLPRPVHNTSS